MTSEETPLDLDAIRERAALLDGRGYGHTADRLLRSDVPRLVAEVRSMTGEILRTHERLAEVRQHILDIDAHATPYGDVPDDPGYAGMYLVTTGALHRALGKIGHTAPKCQAEAQLAEALDVLRKFVDPDPCCFDQNGYCRAHFSDEAPCPVAEARRLTADGPTPTDAAS